MVHNLGSKARASHRMSVPLTSRGNSSKLLSEIVQRPTPSWGFRTLRGPWNQSSKWYFTAVKQEQRSFPQGPLGAEGVGNFTPWTQTNVVNNILGFPPDIQRLCSEKQIKGPTCSISEIWNVGKHLEFNQCQILQSQPDREPGARNGRRALLRG